MGGGKEKMKTTSQYICQECSYISPSYIGKCPECNSWGSLVEEIINKKSQKVSQKLLSENNFVRSSEVNTALLERTKTFDKELDNVLGGGFVCGSLILIAGEPGIGKSTLLLQVADHLAGENLKPTPKKIAYVTAEESLYQIKLRAQRLNLKSNDLLLLCENNLNSILSLIEKETPDIIIIDSIQAIYLEELESTAGSISQVRECANKILRFAKDKNITTIIVGHVNKEGQIAGPKVLEHIVDTVLYFEGEKNHSFRILRGTKNRFGCTDEIAIFEMKENGLSSISSPSHLFMSQGLEPTSGSTHTAITEGTKTIIAEIQALVGGTTYTTPRRVANGLDYNRVLQIIAILERRVGFNFSKHDLYVNLVGGLTSYEPALDLSIAMSIVSCKQDVIPNKKTVFVGEIGLSGEIRQINQIENRIKESIKLGFERIIIPFGSKITKDISNKIEIIEAKKILEAIRVSLKGTVQIDK